eukprot:364228-Chlamydomonas_euryale.AAC.3
MSARDIEPLLVMRMHPACTGCRRSDVCVLSLLFSPFNAPECWSLVAECKTPCRPFLNMHAACVHHRPLTSCTIRRRGCWRSCECSVQPRALPTAAGEAVSALALPTAAGEAVSALSGPEHCRWLAARPAALDWCMAQNMADGWEPAPGAYGVDASLSKFSTAVQVVPRKLVQVLCVCQDTKQTRCNMLSLSQCGPAQRGVTAEYRHSAFLIPLRARRRPQRRHGPCPASVRICESLADLDASAMHTVASGYVQPALKRWWCRQA